LLPNSREIPDSLVWRVLITGLLATGISWHSISVTDALLGALIAFVVVFHSAESSVFRLQERSWQRGDPPDQVPGHQDCG